MGALFKALFDNSLVSSAEAFGCADTTTQEMRAAIHEWFALYFQRKATKEEDPCQRLPYTIVSKLSKAVFGEYQSGIAGSESSRALRWHGGNRSALDKIKKDALQWTAVSGECLLKPVVTGAGFSFTVLRRDRYTVLGRAPDGSITGVGTAELTHAGGKHYTLLEKRSVDAGGLLTIENKLFFSTSAETLGIRVSLATLPQYAALPEVFTYPVPLGGVGLVRMKTPMVNCVDGSGDGVSIYEPAVQLIHNVNANERQFDDEFENGRNRVFVSDELLAPGFDGRKALKDTVFVGLDDTAHNVGVTVFNPALRGESYEQRRQGYLKSTENVIGLKRGILSDAEAVEKTMFEIASSAGEYNLSVIDLQNMWYDAMREALTLCGTLGALYGMREAGAFDPATLTMSWGNGVLYDGRQEWLDDLQAVQSGILRPEIALAHKYDLPWETPEDLALIRAKYMPELADLMSGV